jgi:hypothetical protein
MSRTDELTELFPLVPSYDLVEGQTTFPLAAMSHATLMRAVAGYIESSVAVFGSKNVEAENKYGHVTVVVFKTEAQLQKLQKAREAEIAKDEEVVEALKNGPPPTSVLTEAPEGIL